MPDPGVPGGDLERLRLKVEALFANSAEQPTEAVAEVLGISGKTLRRLSVDKKIGWRSKGGGDRGHRLYAFEDVISYIEGTHRCPRTSPKKTGSRKRSSTISISGLSRSARPAPKGSVVRRARERKRLLTEWKTKCGSLPPSESSASS
jgi:hypothetical protein